MKEHQRPADHYKEAGVDLERGYEVVRRIKDDLARTQRPGVVDSLGRFGGVFDLASLQYKDPVLVSGTDGVGTKIYLAFEMDKHDTVGIDLVAMCVNDVVVQGAEPLFFLDYLALHEADPTLVSELVSGIATGCANSGCALIGGETAEMNDLYAPGHYDLAGFAVGACEREDLIDGSKVQAGDVLIGLSSSGFHSNGYSLLRKIYFKDHNYSCDSTFDELDESLGEALLRPTTLYVKPVLSLLHTLKPHGMAHITGGGFYENLPRMTSNQVGYQIKRGSWEEDLSLNSTRRLGGLDDREMFNIFNMGIGFVIAVALKMSIKPSRPPRNRGPGASHR